MSNQANLIGARTDEKQEYTFESGTNLYLSADSYKAINNIEEQEGYERELQNASSEKTEAELLYNKSNAFEAIKPKVIPPPRNFRTTPVQEFGVDMDYSKVRTAAEEEFEELM